MSITPQDLHEFLRRDRGAYLRIGDEAGNKLLIDAIFSLAAKGVRLVQKGDRLAPNSSFDGTAEITLLSNLSKRQFELMRNNARNHWQPVGRN